MESKCIMISSFIIFIHFLASSHSKSIIKNLPGFPGDLPFKFETGYIGVGENEEVQLFYYFVESQRNPSEDPLLFYLTGGPGVSALSSFLYQIGPHSFNLESSWKHNITLELNPYSWTKMTNMIFVDIPAGVGFSYAKTWGASRSDDSILALQAYDFLRKWLMEHPTFLDNPLYISGISYMGLVIPIVALDVYSGNELGNQPRLNIKGCLIVGPSTDKFADTNSRFEMAHRLALISDDIYESAKETCHGNYVHGDPNSVLCSNSLQRMDECISRINLANVLLPWCGPVNPDPTCQEATNVFVEVWANDKDVQKALNIRQGTIERWEYSNMSIRYFADKDDTIYYSYDVLSSLAYHKKLTTRDCQILIISGDHDMVVPYLGIEEWIRTLNIPIESIWEPWFVHTQIAGYQMTYAHNGYSLKFATIKGSGHVVALYKPEEAFIMVDGWLASHTYSSAS